MLPLVHRTPMPTLPYQHTPFLSTCITSTSSTTHLLWAWRVTYFIYMISGKWGSLCRQGRVVWSLWHGVWPVWQMEKVISLPVLHFMMLCKWDVWCWCSWDTGYAISSVEGQIGVEFFDPSPEVQDQKYVFKYHRQTINDVDHVWPVNMLAFHPVYIPYLFHYPISHIHVCLFASTRQIQHICISRLRQHHLNLGPQSQKAPMPISKILQSNPLCHVQLNRTRLAVGVSYTWDDGEEGAKNEERPAVWVHRMSDEVKVSECAVGWVLYETEVWCFKASTGLESQ